MQEVLDVYRNTVTIFNYHEKTERWYSTVFPAVHLEAAKSASPSAGAGILKGDAVGMILPVSKDRSIKVDDTVKQYIGPRNMMRWMTRQGTSRFTPNGISLLWGIMRLSLWTMTIMTKGITTP